MKSYEVYDSEDEASDAEVQSVGITGVFILLLPASVIGLLVYLVL